MRHARGGSEGISIIRCEDCGNQAKKDCHYLRCRSCCHNRGFSCHTHVNSTWVPAAKRRQKQQQQQHQTVSSYTTHDAHNMISTELDRVYRGYDLEHFPAELYSQAVFRCVRVSTVDDGQEHLSYQTAVSIGGHVFKGILYDQGPALDPPPSSCSSGGWDFISSCQQQQQVDEPLLNEDINNMTSSIVNLNTMMPLLDPSIYLTMMTTPATNFMAPTHDFFPPSTPYYN